MILYFSLTDSCFLFPQVFTTEAGVDITVSEMEDISSQSKHAADFAQRLAVFFYGTEGLRTMKVTTKGGQAMKPISPKKLKFIHSKFNYFMLYTFLEHLSNFR